MIYIYIILIFFIGINLMYLTNRFNLLQLKSFNGFEKVAFALTSSILVFVLYMFILGVLSIEYNQILIIGFLILNLFVSIYLLLSKKICFKISKPNFRKRDIPLIILGLCTTIFVIYYIFSSISTNLIYPDEFSAWALNAKNIYIGKKMNFFINTGLETYPNFLPLLNSGYYFFIDNIAENEIRIFSSIYIIILLLSLIGFCKRNKLDISKLLVCCLIVFLTYDGFSDIATSTYGDIPFMCTYTIGMIYLIQWLEIDRKKEFLIVSAINLMSCCFMKNDGLYLMTFNFFLFLIYAFFSKLFGLKKVKLKESLIYNGVILSLPVAWKIYTIVCKFPADLAAGAGSSFALNLDYTVPLFQNMTSQFFNCIPWVLFLLILIICWFYLYNKLDTKNKHFIVLALMTLLANLAFLILSYLLVFGAEALIAASFIRYMSRVIFIMIVVVLMVLKPIDKLI